VSTPPVGLDAGLAAVAELLGPDGAPVQVVGWDDREATRSLRLELESAQCGP
jgi:hypothetical protein